LVALCAFAACWLGGCESLQVDRITLHHAQQVGVDTIPGAGQVSVAVYVYDRRDTVAPDLFGKWGKAEVGFGRNGLGEQTYPDIVVTEPVELTLKRAIEDELKARGFHVDRHADYAMTIDVNTFFNDYKVGIILSDSVADLNMEVRVLSNDGRVRYSRTISAQGRKALASPMDSFDARIALNRALDQGIQALFDDRALLNTLITDR